MSAGYDGNIKLGVSVTADSKSVVAELGALRKQIVDMFSSVDKSLAGGSGSFSNLEKELTKIARGINDIVKIMGGVSTDNVDKLAESMKEVGTISKEIAATSKSAFDFEIQTASTEELYQKLKQLRKEMEDIAHQKQLEGFSFEQATRSKEYRSAKYQRDAISYELRHGRGVDDFADYEVVRGAGLDTGPLTEQIKHIQNAMSQAGDALQQLQSELAQMSSTDAGFAEKTARVKELESAIASLEAKLQSVNQQLAEMDAQAKADAEDKVAAKNKSDYRDNSSDIAMKYMEIYESRGKQAAEAFLQSYNDILTSRGQEAANNFLDSFNNQSSGNSRIADTQRELSELQSRMKDFNKLKIVMSDEDVAQTLLRIQELKEELARLKQEAMDNALGFTIDTNFAETLEEAKQLRDDLKTYQTTGREFASMEAAQVASMRLADLTQQINEYLLILDPAQQKMAEFTAALSEAESLKSKQDSGQTLTADETRRYEEASATVERYTNDMVSLIEVRNALNSNLANYTKTGLGFGSMEEAQAARTVLEQLNQTIAEYYKTLEPAQQKLAEFKQALADMQSIKERAGSSKNMTAEDRAQFEAARATVNRYRNDLASLMQIRNALSSNIKQFEKTGTGMNAEEYQQAKVLLAQVSQQCENLSGSADKASTALAAIGKADKWFGKLRSSISSVIKKIGSLISAFKKLAKVGTKSPAQVAKGFKKTFSRVLALTLGVRGMYTLLRRVRTAAIETLKTIASQFPEVNAQLSETKTLMTGMKGAVGSMIQPLVSAVLPVLNQVIAALTQAIYLVAKFFAALSGAGVIYKATAKQQDFAESLEGAGGAAKDAVKSLMGFDELNVLQDDAGGGGGGSDLTYEEEAIDPESAVAKFAQMLKEAWSTGDFFDVGQFLGEHLRDGLNKVDDWITTEGYSLSKKLGNSFATLINGFVAVPGLADSIGRTVADAINMAMIGLHQFFTTTNWLDVGKFVADTIMAFFHNINWELLGQTIGSYIMMFVDSLYGFVTNIDFKAIGQYIATSINNIFDVMGEVDETGLNGWQKIGQTISKAITGLLEMIIEFIRTVDWGQIGRAIGEFIESIDFGQIVWDVTVLIANLVAAIAEGLANWAKTEPISAAMATLLGVAMLGVKVAPTIIKVTGFVKKLGEVFKIGADAAGSFKSAIMQVFGPGSIIAGIGMVIGGAITAISSFFSMLKNGFSWLKEILMVIGIAITAVGAIILGAPAVVAGVVAAIVAAVATLVVVVKEHWTEICDFVSEKWDALCKWFKETWSNLQTAWSNFWSNVKQTATNIWTAIKDFFTNTWNAVKLIFDSALKFIETLVTSIFSMVKEKIIEVWTGIRDFIRDTLTSIRDNFTDAWNTIKTTVTTIATNIKSSISGAINGLKSNVSSALSNIKSTFLSVWNGIKSSVTNIVTGMSNTINNVINGVKNAVSGVANAVKNTINTVIRALNGLSFTIPTWVPGMGGNRFGFNIPYLAEGAVIPPNKQFMAVLGDQKHGTNIEAPLDTIKQAVAEELSAFVAVLRAGFDSVVSAVKTGFAATFAVIRGSDTTDATAVSTDALADMLFSILSIIRGDMNNGFAGLTSTVASAANGLSNSISELASKLSESFNDMSYNTGEIPTFDVTVAMALANLDIPHLASGAVVPPNKEFMAVLGDQKQGTNIEAPLDTIKQAVAEELSDYIDAMMAGFDAVVSAIDNKDMDVRIGDSAIGRAAERYQRRQQLVRGSG